MNELSAWLANVTNEQVCYRQDISECRQATGNDPDASPLGDLYGSLALSC